jgi:hypothetical protein
MERITLGALLFGAFTFSGDGLVAFTFGLAHANSELFFDI